MSESIVLYRCTECEHISASLGSLHGHAEKHRGWHGLQWPWKVGDFGALMELTEILHVTDYDEYESIEEVKAETALLNLLSDGDPR